MNTGLMKEAFRGWLIVSAITLASTFVIAGSGELLVLIVKQIG